LNKVYIYTSVRKPGYVYQFALRKGKLYYCTGCKKVGKMRCVTIENGKVVLGAAHPEDGHHEQCQPIPEAGKFLVHCTHCKITARFMSILITQVRCNYVMYKNLFGM